LFLCEVLNRLADAYDTLYERVMTYDLLHSVIRHDETHLHSLLFPQRSVKWVDIIFVSHSSLIKSNLKVFDGNILQWAE